MIFQRELVKWYSENKRPLPWRNTNDAYKIWLSEIILQQTRVEQGLPYFNKFLENFPRIADFALASEAEILKLWQGLGYYSRGRNMLYTAKEIMETHAGIFPTNYIQLIKLKGIGPYTASAIASFSSGEARAVVDGNVFRVLSRYFGITTPIDIPAGQKAFAELAAELLMGQDPAIYNQAIMEFGALVCTPAPKCSICPVSAGCYALKNHQIGRLPVKQKKLVKRTRYFNYFLCLKGDQILMNQRMEGDIWQGLNDLPLIETSTADEPVLAEAVAQKFGKDARIEALKSVKHLLTHQTIFIRFFALENYNGNFIEANHWYWRTLNELDKVPMPIVIHDFLEAFFSSSN